MSERLCRKCQEAFSRQSWKLAFSLIFWSQYILHETHASAKYHNSEIFLFLRGKLFPLLVLENDQLHICKGDELVLNKGPFFSLRMTVLLHLHIMIAIRFFLTGFDLVEAFLNLWLTLQLHHIHYNGLSSYVRSLLGPGDCYSTALSQTFLLGENSNNTVEVETGQSVSEQHLEYAETALKLFVSGFIW